MKKFLVLCLLIGNLSFSNELVWGSTGHRVVGEVAEHYLSGKAKRHLKKLLNGKGLALVSTFADDIKSDNRYKEFSLWHYVNMPLDKKYGEEPISEHGDLITGIGKCIAYIKDGATSDADKMFYLQLLIHFIGDLHQPLHVGRAEDRGGNDIKIQWFGEDSNLHRLWDSDMIDGYEMSYTELASNMPKYSKKERKIIQQGTFIDWLHESQTLAKKVYGSAEVGEKLGYGYAYNHFDTVKEQLYKGGLRLAKALNELF